MHPASIRINIFMPSPEFLIKQQPPQLEVVAHSSNPRAASYLLLHQRQLVLPVLVRLY